MEKKGNIEAGQKNCKNKVVVALPFFMFSLSKINGKEKFLDMLGKQRKKLTIHPYMEEKGNILEK